MRILRRYERDSIVNIKRLVLCFAGTVILWTGRSLAGTISDLYDTGVGSNGVSSPDGTTPDPHYTILSGPLGVSTATVKTSASGYPVGTWWNGDSTTSAWIMPSAGYPGSPNYLPGGDYDYQTTFALPSNANSVAISFNLAADDTASAILLNGLLADTPPSSVNFYGYTPISFSSNNVLSGINTLDFIVYNQEVYYSPTGLRVDGIVGTYTTVPEPGTFPLLGLASIGLLALSRKFGAARTACSAVILWAMPLSAAPLVTLFSTGVVTNDANGNPASFVAVGGIDPYYTILPPSSVTVEPAYAAQPNYIWIGGVLAGGSTPQSKWIAPQVDGENNDPSGDFIYQTTFDLTGFDPSTVTIQGTAFVDNALDDVVLNNSAQTGFLGGSYGPGQSVSFSFTGGFIPGINTLDFTVNNSNPSPSGLNVTMTGTADIAAVPEPTCIGRIGFALLLFRYRSRLPALS
jgi:hypothetical protein